jgi:hypothetical protein
MTINMTTTTNSIISSSLDQESQNHSNRDNENDLNGNQNQQQHWNDDCRYVRIANRLLRIEPSSTNGSICTGVSAALNTHLVMLGDFLNNSTSATIATTTNNNNTIISQKTTRYYSYNDRFCNFREQNSSNNEEESDEYDDDDDDSEPILHWFYYDEPERPIHPALEYETGHLLVSSSTRPGQRNDSNDNADESLILPTATEAISPSWIRRHFLHSLTTASIIQQLDQGTIWSWKRFDWKFFCYLVCLVMSGALNIITAKVQSIAM